MFFQLISAKLAMFDDIIKQMSDCGGVILEKYLCLFVKQAYQIYSSINLVFFYCNLFYLFFC